jgi:hypothetical protein
MCFSVNNYFIYVFVYLFHMLFNEMYRYTVALLSFYLLVNFLNISQLNQPIPNLDIYFCNFEKVFLKLMFSEKDSDRAVIIYQKGFLGLNTYLKRSVNMGSYSQIFLRP